MKFNKFVKYLPYRIRELFAGVAYRTTKRHHVVKIRSLEPNYYDTDTKILHAVMQLVVDFVEIDLSWRHLLSELHDERIKNKTYTLREKLYIHLPWWFTSEEWIRNRDRGLQHLAWEKTLDDDSLPVEERCDEQARVARIIEEVYLWWKDTRPNRPDSYEASGYDSYYRVKKKLGLSVFAADTDELHDLAQRAVAKLQRIEREYSNEDAKMLKKVIDIRESLWS